MELRELRLIVSRYLPLAYLVFAACVAIGCAVAFVPAKTYRTSATIVVDLNNDPALGGASVQQASFLLPAIEERAKSRSLRDRVAVDVPETYRRTRVDIEVVSDSSVLRIRGTSNSAQAAQVWVNAIADRLIEEQSPDSPVALGVLDSAPLKGKPIAPNAEPILAAFIVVGLIGALFSTLAADRIKRAFDTNQAVRERLGTTVLGEVPTMRRRTESRHPVVNLLSGDTASPAIQAAFETIRTNVEFRMAQAGAGTVAVISAGRNSGKTMIAAGLGSSLAAVGRNVVVIEADLRQPTLAAELGVVPRSGLGDVAAFGIETLVLQPTGHPRLELLPAGLPVGRPADVITTSLPGVVEFLDDGNRTVLVDGPPLKGAAESALVISTVRHVVLAIDNSSSGFADLSEAIELINDAGGVLLGVVVNGVSRRRLRRQGDNRRVSAPANVDAVAPMLDAQPVTSGSTASSAGGDDDA